jgi:sugar lactone lactonase YvrE
MLAALLGALLLQAPPDSADYDPATRGLSYSLGAPAVCSAGAVTPDGHLVRTIFTMRPHDAGVFSIAWDGLDDAGKPAPDGAVVKVVVNRGTYRNVAAIGSNPRNPKEHIPSSVSSIAVGAGGNFWTAHGYDEAGESITRWDVDGNRLAGYGVGAFVHPNGMPYAVAVDGTYLYFCNGCFDGTQQVARWQITGNPRNEVPFPGTGRADGHIQVRDSTVGELQAPIPALATDRGALWVVDVVGQQLHRYDKATGKDLGGFPLPAPRAVAVDPSGRIWASHDGGTVGVYMATGARIKDALTNQGTVESLAFSPDGTRLALADSQVGQVRVYGIFGTTATLRLTIGQKAVPGDRAADHFYQLRCAALLPDGSILASQKEPSGGARLAKFSPTGTLLWEYFSNEFVAAGNYSAGDPDTLYSSTLHRYTLKDRAAGAWEYAGSADPGVPLRRAEAPHHPMSVVRLGGRDFVFLPTNLDLLICLVDGPVLRQVGATGGRHPSKMPDDRGSVGQWSWCDANDDGKVDDAEVVWASPFGTAKVFGRTGADRSGNLVIIHDQTRAAWTIPIGPLSDRGYPTYDMAKARLLTGDAFACQVACLAEDGGCYAIGWEKDDPRKAGETWQAAGTLARYAPDGTRLWAVTPPEIAVGMDTIPGGGVIVGGRKSASLYHYTADGLLVGQVGPGEPMGGKAGYFDIMGAVSVNRDPRDGVIDVFTERVSPGGLGWYRIDDRGLATPGPAAPVPPPVLTIDAVDDAGVTLSIGDAKVTVPKAFLGSKVKAGDKVTIGKAVAP